MMSKILFIPAMLFRVRFQLSIFCMLFFGFIASTYSQDFSKFHFEQYTSENKVIQQGLSQNTIAAIHQDSYGFLWFGSWDGLNRFDGYSFLVYNRNHGLTSENITALSEDKKGNLWIGTDLGISIMNLKTGLIRTIRSISEDSLSSSPDNVLQIICDKKGRIIVLTDRGIDIYNEEKKLFEPFIVTRSPISKELISTANCILEASNSQYLIGTDSGLLVYNPINKTADLITCINGIHFSQGSVRIKSLLKDSKQNLWLGTNKGLIINRISDDKILTLTSANAKTGFLIKNDIHCLLQDRFSNIWIGTETDGIFVIDHNSGNLEGYNKKNGISNDRIICLYSDYNNNVWIGTFFGVTRINLGTSIFRLYSGSDKPGSLQSTLIWDFLEYDQNEIWIATDEGIAIFNLRNNTFKKFSDPTHEVLSKSRIRSLFRDSDGLIWIGTEINGLYSYLPRQKKITHFPVFDLDQSNLPIINFIEEDQSGILWIGTSVGLYSLEKGKHNWNKYFHNTNSGIVTFNSMIIGNDGYLWFGTNKGLLRLNTATMIFSRRDNYFSFNGPNTNEFFGLYQTSEGNIWAGSKNGGLVYFNQVSGEYVAYTSKQGLANNLVYAIIPDSNNCLWLSTNGGISRFDTINKSFINFDVHDGLQSNEFNAGANLKSSSGDIFFGGIDGFNVFNPEDILINHLPPRVAISLFRIFNEVTSRNLSDGDEIILKHDDNYFSFEFTALDFSRPGKTKYAYMLEGLENDWNYIDASRRIAIYKKVNPGTYRFRLKACNDHGIWNENGIAIKLKILSPWYTRLSVQLPFLLMMVFLTIWLINRKIQQIKRKNEEERQFIEFQKHLFDVEQKTLRLQMNPHFIYNALNSIQSYIVSSDNKHAIEYLAKFSRLMRIIFTNSQKVTIPLSEELKAIYLYLEIEKLRFDDHFEFIVHVSLDINEDSLEVPPLLIQPFIENSIIHGIIPGKGEGKIILNIKKIPDQVLLIEIEDNGIGRNKAQENLEDHGLNRRPSALAIMEERCKLLTKQFDRLFNFEVIDLYDPLGNPLGTKVRIKTPLMVNNQKIKSL